METQETIEETLDASGLNKVQIKARFEAIEEALETGQVDGRSLLAKRLKVIEATLADHEKRITECSIRR